MVRRTITIGDQSFQIARITLGTVRRVPTALNVATAVMKDYAKSPTMVSPGPEEMNALIALIHDGLTAAGETITLDALTTKFDNLDMVPGLVAMFEAVGAMFKPADDAPVTEVVVDQGNSVSS